MFLAILAAVLVCGAAIGLWLVDPGKADDATPDTTMPDDSEIIFDSTFDDNTLDPAVWNTCHWWNDDGCTITSNNELQWYRPEQVWVHDGMLSLVADEREVLGSDGEVYRYVSGMVTTGPPDEQYPARFDFTYGRVEARVRAPEGVGLWAAIWLLPSTTESRPEIDILEVLGNDLTEWIFHLHPEDRERESDAHRITSSELAEGWHDVALDWEPGRLRWLVDGEVVWTVEGERVPSEPMYLVANLAVGGVYPGPPDSDTEFPASFDIDRITVRQTPR